MCWEICIRIFEESSLCVVVRSRRPAERLRRRLGRWGGLEVCWVASILRLCYWAAGFEAGERDTGVDEQGVPG